MELIEKSGRFAIMSDEFGEEKMLPNGLNAMAQIATALADRMEA